MSTQISPVGSIQSTGAKGKAGTYQKYAPTYRLCHENIGQFNNSNTQACATGAFVMPSLCLNFGGDAPHDAYSKPSIYTHTYMRPHSVQRRAQVHVLRHLPNRQQPRRGDLPAVRRHVGQQYVVIVCSRFL